MRIFLLYKSQNRLYCENPFSSINSSFRYLLVIKIYVKCTFLLIFFLYTIIFIFELKLNEFVPVVKKNVDRYSRNKNLHLSIVFTPGGNCILYFQNFSNNEIMKSYIISVFSFSLNTLENFQFRSPYS